MDVKLSTSSHTSFEAGVYDKTEGDAQYHDERAALERDGETPPSRLRAVVVAALVLLFIFSFVAIVTSGLVFGHRVSSSGDCLAQSCVMFAVCVSVSPISHPLNLISSLISLLVSNTTGERNYPIPIRRAFANLLFDQTRP